jgi:hypothetical protein
MRACADATRTYGVQTIVSLNPLMVDGTGMCGGCRVEVDGVTRFACVHGPEFDGHGVNFDQLMSRLRFFSASEVDSLDRYAKRTCACELQAAR